MFRGPGTYPPTRNLWEIVRDWNPDNVSMPFPFVEQLQVLNYSDARERRMAESYRNMELPFKIFDVPDVEAVRDKWTDGYLVEHLDESHSAQFKIERSVNNHFMYWRQPSSEGKRKYPDWKSPTTIVSQTFAEWLSLAHHADEDALHHEEEHKSGQEKGDSPSLQRECFRSKAREKSIHASTSPREMNARPKMSQIEWKTIEIRASKVGNFSPFSCPGTSTSCWGRRRSLPSSAATRSSAPTS